jgi:hypothetical protein
MRDVRTWTRHVRRGIASLFSLLLISSPVVAYGQTVSALWDASPSTDQVTGYQVCIGTTSMSCSVQLASVSNTQTQYTFTVTGGVIHYVAIRAVNSSGPGSYSTETTFSIPAFTQPVNQSSPVGVSITPLNLSVTDPDGSARTFTHTGLPTGLALNATTGQITGIPSAAGTYNVTVFVTDSLVTVSRSFVWTITAPAADTTAPALAITSHTNGQTLSSASVTVSGTASDSGRGGNGVSSVTVNGQAATGGTASGTATASWSRALTLSPGANTITVQATDSRGNIATQAITLNYAIAPVSSATLSASVASPQNAGTAVTFTAGGSGGVAPRQYKFFVQPSGGAAQMVRDWSTTNTYAWTPTTAASYTVIVWARSAGVTVDAAQASAQMAYTINTPAPAPVTSVTLSPSVATPQNTGTAITFTAAGAGGVGPREYKFLMRQGSGADQVVQNWSTTAIYAWTPTTAASYTVTVWARSAGVTVDAAQASAQMAYVINTPPVSPVTGATLTANVASPQTTGTAITFTAGGSGGVAPQQFKFLVQQAGAAAQVVQNWSTSATYTWTTTTAASYTISVWVRSAGVTTDAPQASAQLIYTIGTPLALSISSLSSNVASPQVIGTAISFSAVATGGTAPYQFKWWVSDGSAWRVAQDWGTNATFNWAPTMPGDYLVAVWARNNGVNVNASQALAQVAYKITSTAPVAPLSISRLTSNLASPQVAGTTITFNTAATGGQAPYQFKWWVYDGSSWRVAQNWNSSATLNWRPTAAGDYMVAVWARSSGVTVEASQAMGQVFYTITNASSVPPPAPLAISSLTSNATSPSMLGTTVTFSAVATGGTAPYQFKWWVFDGASWRSAQDWSTSATFNWRPTSAGSYLVAVWGRSNGVTANTSQALAQTAYTISSTTPTQPLAITSFRSSVASPQAAGSTVTFTAAATGGQAPYEFKWWVFDGETWRVGQNWSASSTFNWRPTKRGTYMVAVWARNAGVKTDASQALAQMTYIVN